MNSNNSEVGDRIDSYCTKCRLWLEHTIIVKIGTEIKNVKCMTCNGIHKYRSHIPGIKRKTLKDRAVFKISSSHTTKKIDKEWEEFMAKSESANQRPYMMQDSYKTGEIINHKKFGLGIVTGTEGHNKIKVLFENGPKMLVCNKKL